MDDDIQVDLDKKFRYPDSFQDLLNNKNLKEPIKAKINITPGEIILIVLKYCLKHRLSHTSLSQLMRLENTIFSRSILPESKYILDKIFNPKTSINYHVICSNCKYYVGKLDTTKSSISCSNCNDCITTLTPSCTNFFVLINPVTAIENLLNKYADYYTYVLNERIHEKGQIKDIYDGKGYRNFIKNLPNDKKKTVYNSYF